MTVGVLVGRNTDLLDTSDAVTAVVTRLVDITTDDGTMLSVDDGRRVPTLMLKTDVMTGVTDGVRETETDDSGGIPTIDVVCITDNITEVLTKGDGVTPGVDVNWDVTTATEGVNDVTTNEDDSLTEVGLTEGVTLGNDVLMEIDGLTLGVDTNDEFTETTLETNDETDSTAEVGLSDGVSGTVDGSTGLPVKADANSVLLTDRLTVGVDLNTLETTFVTELDIGRSTVVTDTIGRDEIESVTLGVEETTVEDNTEVDDKDKNTWDGVTDTGADVSRVTSGDEKETVTDGVTVGVSVT